MDADLTARSLAAIVAMSAGRQDLALEIMAGEHDEPPLPRPPLTIAAAGERQVGKDGYWED